jgi:hypothetical protein
MIAQGVSPGFIGGIIAHRTALAQRPPAMSGCGARATAGPLPRTPPNKKSGHAPGCEGMVAWRRPLWSSGAYELLILLATLAKVPLAFLPRAVTAGTQTTMISASMTAYSTEVGPSSAFKKRTTGRTNRDNMASSSLC